MIGLLSATLAFLPFQPAADLRGWKFLDDQSKRAFRFFIERTHPVSGLTKDRSHNFNEIDSADHVVASVASTGYALAAYGIGAQRGWIDRKDAIEKSMRTLEFLVRRTTRYRGWFYHWLHWETGQREWKSEISTIDSALLFCGMIVAERSLKDRKLTALTNKILKEVDWRDMLTDGGSKPDSLTISHGWRPEEGYLKNRWHDYSEQSMLYIMAMGADPAFPEQSWDKLERKVVTEYGLSGITGGPLFMHQMSHGYIDFKGKRDRLGFDYWVSSRNLTLIQREYGSRNPKNFAGYSQNIWGLSACDIPTGYGAQGFPSWGGDIGTVAAPAAVASVLFTPQESMAAAEAFLAQYPQAYGRYGFSSGISPKDKWHSDDAIGIDQGQLMVCIESARDGLPQKLFMSHPIVKKGLQRAGLRKTQEGAAETRALQKIR